LFSGEGAKVPLFGIAAVIGNHFGFLQARLVLESGFLNAIQKVVPYYPIEPGLAILNLLATATGNEVAKKDLLQGVLGHFAIPDQRLGKSEQSGRVILVEIDDLAFDRVERSLGCRERLTERRARGLVGRFGAVCGRIVL
jgi:hypothetical protein